MIGAQLRRLGRHAAIYGLGGLVSRILAVLLLPLYTSYLTTTDYGRVETLIALTAILVTLLRAGISTAFFRFYFDSKEPAARVRVLRTAFWFTIATSTAGLVAGWAAAPWIAELLNLGDDQSGLVRAAFVGLWAQMNYEQLTALFRVEERSTAFVAASLANVLLTIATTVLLVVVFEQGALGVIVGNFTGTLLVYLGLLGYRREQLGLEFDRDLLRRMNRFGLPLVPSGLALWTLNFSDRFFLAHLAGQDDVGRYSLGVRVASAMVLLLVAFRTAWPAFAYSIDDDGEARRTYGFVLTYLLFVACWLSLALGSLAPWIVQVLARDESFWAGANVVAPLAFAGALWGAYTVVAIGIGRLRRTQFNWVITGAAAALNVALNVILVPRYGIEGAAAAAVAAFALMFVAMAVYAQRLYPVPYQWRRVGTVIGAAVALTVAARLVDRLDVSVALVAAFPLVLAPLGFYLPAERARARALLSRA
ncbi:MAG TPA: lipopolysaccharide biosynthesis protein [Gaiellaceae bacterium]|nr:lipopolysaccharide biosynthesis protein [Gaiellaceae bacterium]